MEKVGKKIARLFEVRVKKLTSVPWSFTGPWVIALVGASETMDQLGNQIEEES